MSDMPAKAKLLIQLDADLQPSVFDRVVAIDADVDQVLAHGGVTLEQVESLVHGAIFTRGGGDLKRTAIFIGGSDVASGEAMLKRVADSFFGPMRVSVMLDANGANTTAVAAVLCASRHLTLSDTSVLVLAGTGPVGQRAARLLAHEGAQVKLASRSLPRASNVAAGINAALGKDQVQPCATSDDDGLKAALNGVALVISAGKTGVRLLPENMWQSHTDLRVLIDLNAVPPAGIEGVEPMNNADQRGGVIIYGAIGIGGRKMKIHKAALRSLFEANDRVLDAETIYALAKALRP